MSSFEYRSEKEEQDDFGLLVISFWSFVAAAVVLPLTWFVLLVAVLYVVNQEKTIWMLQHGMYYPFKNKASFRRFVLGTIDLATYPVRYTYFKLRTRRK